MIETFEDLYHAMRELAQGLRRNGHATDAGTLDDAAITIQAMGDRFGPKKPLRSAYEKRTQQWMV